MIKIRANAGVITQINVFTVPPGGQRALVDVLGDAVACAREQPGWLSASLHMSLDGTRVVNYAQSDSLASAEAVVTRLKMAASLIATRHTAKPIPDSTRWSPLIPADLTDRRRPHAACPSGRRRTARTV
jgi:hypothetical protein